MAGPFNRQHSGTGAQVAVYTSPAAPTGKGTVVSSLVIAGVSPGTTATAEVRIAPAGAADAPVHVVVPAFAVSTGSHLALTEGLTLAPGDVLRVTASAGVNVHVYGTEL